jgi:prophage regulatory protein
MADSPSTIATDDSYVRLPGVQKTVGLSRSSIHRMVKSGDFPMPRRIGKRAVAWLSSDLARWRADRPEAA